MSSAIDTAHNNPFPGLRPFNEDEVYLFFGRESQVDAMVDKLAATRFLAVVGTSGSGKSSLVNCGLRPALLGGLLARAGSAWRVAQFRPGSDPLGEMASALAKDGVLFSDHEASGLPLSDIIDTTLCMSKLGLVDIVQQARLAEGTNLLLVVDQFEELFRYRQSGTDDDGANEDKHANSSEQSTEAAKLYLQLAKELGISLTTLSLAFVNQRPFVTSNIIGATNLEQLKENIASIDTELSQETLDRIDAIHATIPNPAP
jgi:hypothetical protein